MPVNATGYVEGLNAAGYVEGWKWGWCPTIGAWPREHPAARRENLAIAGCPDRLLS